MKTVKRAGLRKSLISTLLVCAFVGAAHSEEPVHANGLAVLFTDYGADSIYVGAIKGSMYAKAPQVRIDTLTNSIPAYDVVTAAYLLVEGCQTFPQGTTFCCVVDPGVGTSRRSIALETKNGWRFVGPDNGMFTLVAEKYGVSEVRECTNKKLWRVTELSHTFQGRDIYGPVTASIAEGTPLIEVGEPISDFVRLEIETSRVEGKKVRGKIIRLDDYGNVITNVPQSDLEKINVKRGDKLHVVVGGSELEAPFVSTYADVPVGANLVAIQSAGYVELAINQGSMAKKATVAVQADVSIEPAAAK